MDKLVEFLTTKIGYVLITILGFIVPGVIFIFVWNRQVYMELSWIGCVLLAFGVSFLIYIPTMLMLSVITGTMEKVLKKKIELEHILLASVVLTFFEMMYGSLYKIFNDDFMIRDYVMHVGVLQFLVLGVFSVMHFGMWLWEKTGKKIETKEERKMKYKRKNRNLELYIMGIVVAVLIVVLFPLLIAVGTSADIFMWVTNDNDWIGFWGDYVAMLVGGAITLYVLFKSLADSRNTMQETLANERKIQEYNEIRQFGDLLIEKSAAFSVKLEEMTYKAPYCIYGKGKPEYINYISDFSKEFRIVRSILIEISMHLEVIDGKKSYYTEKGKQLSETVENLMLILNKYHKKILEQERDEEIEKTICDLSNDLINQTQDFLKEIV